VITQPVIPVILDAFVCTVTKIEWVLGYNHLQTSPAHYSVTGSVFASAVVDSH